MSKCQQNFHFWWIITLIPLLNRCSCNLRSRVLGNPILCENKYFMIYSFIYDFNKNLLFFIKQLLSWDIIYFRCYIENEAVNLYFRNVCMEVILTIRYFWTPINFDLWLNFLCFGPIPFHWKCLIVTQICTF